MRHRNFECWMFEMGKKILLKVICTARKECCELCSALLEMSCAEFSCAGLSKGRHREKTLLNLGAHTSQTDSPCWDSRGTEKRKEKVENIPHSQTCHPCQVHVKVAWEGKEAMALSVEPGQHKEHLMMCPDTVWQGWTDSVFSAEN